jgi:Ferredoxin subunits of nitrite reductase and ring-hydroxylating dioxygenases
MNILEWHNTGLAAADIANNELREVSIAGKLIGLVHRGGQVHAFAGKCPHAGAPLCNGWLDAQGRIVCPLHKYRFDPQNGRNTTGEGYKLFTYPVRLEDDTIWVGLVPPAL